MLTVGKLREIIAGLPEDTPVVYAWTWRSPSDVSLGSYLQASENKCVLLDGNTGAWEKQFGNVVLWKDEL